MSDLSLLIKNAQKRASSKKFDDISIEMNIQILKIDSKNCGAYTRLAKCFEIIEKYAGSLEMYKKVLEFDYDNIIARNGKSRIEKKIKNNDLRESIKGMDDQHEIISIGIAAKQGSDNNIAIIAFERAREICASEFILSSLGGAYRHAGKYDKAEEIYNEAIGKYSSNVSMVGLAAVYRDKKMIEEAYIMLIDVLKKDVHNKYALAGLSGVYKDLDAWSDEERKAKNISELHDLIKKDLQRRGVFINKK